MNSPFLDVLKQTAFMLICAITLLAPAYGRTEPCLVWNSEARVAAGFKAPLELASGDILVYKTVPVQPQGMAVICYRSKDGGISWNYLSEIVRDTDPHVDIGDGHMIQLKSGELLYSYRHNLFVDLPLDKHVYRLEVAASTDNGKTWKFHSEIARSEGTDRGLWSTFLLQKKNGVLQCYFDDEQAPAAAGFLGHQWIQMKTWNPNLKKWENPVTVSRAFNPEHLSREGMCSVVELPNGKLVCALESVQTYAPNRGVLRIVFSNDGGKTWSCQKQERAVLYQPQNPDYNALAPWMIQFANGQLLCVFTTDEDRNTPGVASTGILYQSPKYITSSDGGKNWSKAMTISAQYPIYFPGVCQLKHGSRRGIILVQFHHSHHGAFIIDGRATATSIRPKTSK